MLVIMMKLFEITGFVIVLEVNNRDSKTLSWYAHVVGLLLPFLLINIKLADGGNRLFVFVSVTTLKVHKVIVEKNVSSVFFYQKHRQHCL